MFLHLALFGQSNECISWCVSQLIKLGGIDFIYEEGLGTVNAQGVPHIVIFRKINIICQEQKNIVLETSLLCTSLTSI